MKRYSSSLIVGFSSQLLSTKRTEVTSWEGTRNDFMFQTGKGATIVDFYTEWCGPCRKFAPTFAELSENHKDVKFIKVNVEEHEELGVEFNVRSIPTIMAIKDGKVVERIEGPLLDKVKKAIAEVEK